MSYKSALMTLRSDLDEVDEHIGSIGWDKANGIIKSYRHWLITAINFIQLKHFDCQS